MSEDLIKNYQDLLRDLGMSEERLNSYTSIEEFKVAVQMQKELNEVKKNSEPEPTQPASKILGIDMSRENAQAFASDVAKYVENMYWDERVVEDERFKRDNDLQKISSTIGEVVILRDKDGRCA